MARINSVSVGRAAKKLGNMVYYSMNGKTYARARVEHVKNPKTAKQMAQRLIFTTAVRSRDALKSIVDHSFENKKYGSESLNYFMKRNLEILRARAAADNGLTGSFNVPYGITMQANPLLVSQGTLQSMDYQFSEEGLSTSTLPSGDIITVGQFIERNPQIHKGDQITVMLLVPTHNYEATTASGEAVDATRLIKMRITIPANIADDAVFYKRGNLEFGSLLITEGLENFSFGNEENKLVFQGNDDEIGLCGCIIVSRPEGKKWLRSTEYMKMNPNYDDSLYNFNDVLNTWMQGTTEIIGLEDNEYLNQGQEAEVSNSYSLQSRQFNMTDAATGEINLDVLAALDTNTSNGSRITQIIYTQTSAQIAEGKITCYKLSTAANTLVPATKEYNKPSNAAALITFDDANRLLGGVLSIQQG